MAKELTLEEINAIPEQQAQQESSDLRDYVLNPLQKAASLYDVYGGGASARAATLALLKGQNPATAAIDQYGKEGAPTGEQIATQLGVDKLNAPTPIKYEPSYGGYGAIPQYKKGIGTLAEVALDPISIVPIGKVIGTTAKTAGKVGLGALETGTKIAANVADVASGTDIATRAVTATEKVIKGTADALANISKPKIRPDYDKLLNIAKKHNLEIGQDIPGMEFEKSSTLAMAGKARASTPSGEALRNQYTKASDSITDAFDTVISGEPVRGKAISASDAGANIREALTNKRKQVLNDADMTYRTTADKISGGQIVPLNPESKARITREFNNYKGELERKLNEGVSAQARAEAQEIIGIINQLQNSTGDIRSFSERLQELGQIAFDKRAKLGNVEYKRTSGILPKIYNAGRESFIETTRKLVGNDIADSLVQNNKNISDFLKNSDFISKIADNANIADEQVFRRLIQNGNTKQIEQVVNMFPELRQNLSSTMIENFARRDATGTITNWNELRNVFGKKKLDQFKVLLDENQAKEIADLSMFADEVIGTKLTPPAAGVSGSWKDVVKNVQDDILNEMVYQTLRNKAYKSSGIKRLAEMAKNNDLTKKDVMDTITNARKDIQTELKNKLGAISVRKTGARITETTRDKSKENK